MVIFSVVVIFFSDILISRDYYVSYYKFNYIENRLVIPDIDFDMVIYDIDSLYNDVDSGIEMLDSSDKSKRIYFFAGHSGNGDNCYFNRVKELKYGDVVYLYMDGIVFSYKIVEFYNIVKKGYMEVDYELCDVLYLITCNNYNGQLIVKGVLIN